MNRPYIFCHMIVSADGKIKGNFFRTPQAKDALDVFDEIAFGPYSFYKPDAWLCGRVTSDEYFTNYEQPKLPDHYDPVPEGDYISRPNEDLYYFTLDPSGKLAWRDHTAVMRGQSAEVVEVLTEKASDAYKAYLREREISYIIAGETEIDYDLALQKIMDEFSVQTLLLGGGGILNWSFVERGLCEELSLVIAPVADGSSQTRSVFDTRDRFSDDSPVSFKLLSAEPRKGGTVWLRYYIDNSTKLGS